MTPDKASRRAARRAARADKTRAKALSPLRIILQVATIPVMAAGISISVYVRTSDYPPNDAMRHLFALAGCEAAASVGLSGAARGGIGYHARNDPDGDGIACDAPGQTRSVSMTPETAPEAPRMQSGAKFLKP